MTIEITQADREAAAELSIWSNEQRKDVLSGKLDANPNVKAFARHRQAAYEKGQRDAVERVTGLGGGS